jgi:integrase
MGVRIRKEGDGWYVFINHHGQRKARKVGSKAAAEKVKKILEAKLSLGDSGVLTPKSEILTFGAYADQWLVEYAAIACKQSTQDDYKGVLKNYLRPKFASKPLGAVRREDMKRLIAEMIRQDYAKGTIRNTIATVRKMYNEAIEAGLVTTNPAAKLGRYMKAARSNEKKGISLTPGEVQQLLQAALAICPEYEPLFRLAVRAGLRRGELVALRWGDLHFGAGEDDPNRYIYVQHNYVRRLHTDTKSHKARRVDMSRDLRRALLRLRDERLLVAYANGQEDILDVNVFLSPEGGILDPDNLYHRYFRPVLTAAGIRKVRLHDLRHTFGSLLIQNGASVVYVKEQMGHSSIQLTVDTYGHLIPGADVRFVDNLDDVLEKAKASEEQKNAAHESASPAQVPQNRDTAISPEVVDLVGGGGWTRTSDLRIMRPSL